MNLILPSKLPSASISHLKMIVLLTLRNCANSSKRGLAKWTFRKVWVVQITMGDSTSWTQFKEFAFASFRVCSSSFPSTSSGTVNSVYSTPIEFTSSRLMLSPTAPSDSGVSKRVVSKRYRCALVPNLYFTFWFCYGLAVWCGLSRGGGGTQTKCCH